MEVIATRRAITDVRVIEDLTLWAAPFYRMKNDGSSNAWLSHGRSGSGGPLN
jgi:hypothetical protein